MSKQAYRIDGDFQMGRIRQHFSIEILGADEAAAREAIYAQIGSRHGVPRRQIAIEGVKSVPADQVQDLIVKHKLEA